MKIILLHSVSVITIFAIPKRDRKTDKKTSYFFVYSGTSDARFTIPTILGMMIEEVRPVFAPPNFY